MDPEIQNDANSGVDSSNTSTEQADATASQVTDKSAAEPSIADVAKEAYKQSTSSQEDLESDVQNTDKTANDKETTNEEQVDPESDTDVPFHDHPRWKEVTKKAKETEDQLAALTTQTKDWEEAAQRVQYHDAYMQENNISPEDFKAAMSFLALRNSDPAQARSLLKPLWESTSAFDDNFISPEVQQEILDIEKAVKDSEISRPLADKQIKLLKDQARAAAQQQLQQRRGQMTAQQQQRAVANSIGQTLHSWEATTAKKDPAFKAKSANGKDGVYELTCAKYAFLANIKPPRSAADAAALAEQAYTEAKDIFTPAKAAARPQITSSRSSTAKQNGDPKTIAGTVAAVARKHGYSWTPPVKRK